MADRFYNLNGFTEIEFSNDGVPLSVVWSLDDASSMGMSYLPTNEYLQFEVESYLFDLGWEIAIVDDPVFNTEGDLVSTIHLVH